MPVNVFDVPKVVNLVLPESTGANGAVMSNYPMNRTDFTLLTGVNQTIQFFVRDIDRQPVSETGQTLTLIITDEYGTSTLLTRAMTVTNAALGLYAVAFVPSDLLEWDLGPKQYSVMITRADGTQTMLWTDRNYTPYGTLTVINGPFPVAAAPTILDLTAFLTVDGWKISSAFPATIGLPDAAVTLAVSTTAFSGTVKLQGSLAAQPGTDDSQWFDILSQPFQAVSGTTSMTATGAYTWLRVQYTYPEVQGSSAPPNPPTTGSVDRILFKG